MQAFLNDPKVKEKYVSRVLGHQKADEIVKRIYWKKGKGCAVGCTIEGSDHKRYETELGIPELIAHLEDSLFESMSNGEAKAFPLKFLEAIPVGADLSKVIPKLVIWQFEDEKYGIKHIKEVQENKEVFGLCEKVLALYKRELAGDKPTEDEYYKLYLKIDVARARAWPWAWAWAEAGAEAWAGAWAEAEAGARARAGAGARAWARAWAWVGADYDARYNEAINATANKLIELLKDSNK